MSAYPLFSPFLLSAFAWNFALSMSYLLVPLYALELGFSGLQIGSLVGLPVLLQVVFNLVGGVLVDRMGAKRITLIASMGTAFASVIYALSGNFAGLLAGQLLFIVSRAAFWPANWALASQLPGESGRNMGQLNSTTSAGQIGGIAASGMVVHAAGLQAGFWVMALVSLLSLALAAAIRYTRAPHSGKRASLIATYSSLAAIKPMYLGMLCSFISCIPFTMSSSFYPVLLVEQGFSSDAAGWLLSIRAVGSIFAGLLLARWIKSAESREAPMVCGMVIAATLGLIPLTDNAWAIGLLMATIGLASGVLTVYFQMLVSSSSPTELRGSAMSFGGLGWQACNLAVPPIMGGLRDEFGFKIAFFTIAGLMLAATLTLAPVHVWALIGRTRRKPG